MNILMLKFREAVLKSKARYISETLDEIESIYQRDKADGRARYRATIDKLRKVRQQIALKASPAVLLNDVFRGR